MMSRGGSAEARLCTGNGASAQAAHCQRDAPHRLHFDLSPDSRWYPVPMTHDLSFHPGAVDVRFTNALLWEDFLLGASSLSAPSRLSPLCLIIHCKSTTYYLTGHSASQTFLCLVPQHFCGEATVSRSRLDTIRRVDLKLLYQLCCCRAVDSADLSANQRRQKQNNSLAQNNVWTFMIQRGKVRTFPFHSTIYLSCLALSELSPAGKFWWLVWLSLWLVHCRCFSGETFLHISSIGSHWRLLLTSAAKYSAKF